MAPVRSTACGPTMLGRLVLRRARFAAVGRRTPLVLATFVVSAVWSAGMCAQRAVADGDPGSDVLVNQSLFLPSDAGVGRSCL